ncbi:hypothetical protein CHS0354_029522 [Potamilus streckersoni]|uniref:Chromatin assembly factor 1 subunit A n=1 Tax=Potamilus streckersoni TaxID=2493646 RepID=A0AAE0WC18_9BIVA|nr:hypothetical protein CHS0354_029522 [Potamilus streckersoni]
MTNVDCEAAVDMVMNEKELLKSDECPPPKKLKQARLPFKPLPQPPLSPLSGGKKRKLSENESPGAKIPKIGRSGSVTQDKLAAPEGEQQVSSSSEAENIAAGTQKGCKSNTLDRFVKRSFPEEISSTNCNDCIVIDVNEEDVQTPEPSPIVKPVGTIKSPQSVIGVTQNDLECEPKKAQTVEEENCSKENVSADETATKDIESSKSDKALQQVDTDCIIVDPSEDKENDSVPDCHMIEDDEGSVSESSFIYDHSVCEAALITPAKTKPMDSFVTLTPGSAKKSDLLFPCTPVSSRLSDVASTPVSQSSGASCSDETSSTKKSKSTSKLSESKRKEKGAMRQRINEQKEKEKEERRLQKEKEREEKMREKEEKKKHKELEKAEKEKQRQEEKEKKEKERLEKLQQKEEEKKKKQEVLDAKIEEKRKKEEERKQKLEEKKREEDEKARKDQQRKEAFQSFFIKQSTTPPPKLKDTQGPFMPFEVKKDMKLAPECRWNITEEMKKKLEEFLAPDHVHESEELYLQQLKNGKYLPGKYGKTLPKNDDIEILCHDSEALMKTTYRVKLLQFCDNHRPPYYGTWRKKSKNLTPRNPFKQDEDLFDYDVESDLEWEEEEQGESISSSEGEDDEEVGEDEEDEEDPFFVPHGYLSEGEGCSDEEVPPEIKKIHQQAIAQAWENQVKKPTQLAIQMVIGCVWEDETTSIAAEQLKKLLQFKAVRLTPGPIHTSLSYKMAPEVTEEKENEKSSTGKGNCQKKAVPEQAIPALIQLVHGNFNGIQKLIKEFRMYWKIKTTEKGSPTAPEESRTNEGKNSLESREVEMEVEEYTDAASSPQEESKNPKLLEIPEHEFNISKRQLERKIPSIAVREKRKGRKICWYVHEEVLKQYGFENLPVENNWEYVTDVNVSKNQNQATPKAEEANSVSEKRNTPNIMQYAQPMSLSQIQAAGVTSIAKDFPTSEATLSSTGSAIQVQSRDDRVIVKDVVQEAKLLPCDQRSIMDFIRKKSEVKKEEKGDSKSNVIVIESKESGANIKPADKSKEMESDQPSAGAAPKAEVSVNVDEGSSSGCAISSENDSLEPVPMETEVIVID